MSSAWNAAAGIGASFPMCTNGKTIETVPNSILFWCCIVPIDDLQQENVLLLVPYSLNF